MHYIGIDVGGTQLRVAAFDQSGKLTHRANFPNDHNQGPSENLDLLAGFIKGWDIDYEGIGIGCPGPLDFHAGKILTPPNLPGWQGVSHR